MIRRIPDRQDWGVDRKDCALDTEYAFRNFGGLSLEEAVQGLLKREEEYTEDFLWMPSTPFRYYFPAVALVLLDKRSEGNAMLASGFLDTIEFKLEERNRDLDGMWEQLKPALRKLSDCQDWYDADVEIFGSFAARVDEILKAVGMENGQDGHYGQNGL